MYTKRILNSIINAKIEICFIQMQCDIEALIHVCVLYVKRFDVILNLSTAIF